MAVVAAPQTWEKSSSRTDLDSLYCSVTNCLYPHLRAHIWKQCLPCAGMGSSACLFSWILGWEYTILPTVTLLHKVGSKEALDRACGFIGVARICKAMAQVDGFEIFWASGHAKNSMIGNKKNSSIAIYFIPEKSSVLMTKKEQKTPPKTNQPLLPTRTHLIDIGHGVGEGFFIIWYSSRSHSKLLTEVWSSGYIWGNLALKEKLELHCLVHEHKQKH